MQRRFATSQMLKAIVLVSQQMAMYEYGAGYKLLTLNELIDIKLHFHFISLSIRSLVLHFIFSPGADTVDVVLSVARITGID